MRRNLLGGHIFHFFGGAHAPAAPPPVVAPPKADVPDNTSQQAAKRKQGLQATLLTGGTDTSGGLGGSVSTLGSSTPSTAFASQPNAYGGQA